MRQQIEFTNARRLALAALVAVSATAMGCKSSMPRMNMFGFGKPKPSAEMLAGSGPSMTYPAPPSASASPEAIASIAGGTATPDSTSPTQIAPSGFGTPSTQIASLNKGAANTINSAAAKANGFGTTTPSSYSSPSTTSTASAGTPAGYSSPSYPVPSFAAPSAPSTASDNLASSGSAAVPSGYRFGQSTTKPVSATTTPTAPIATGPSSYSLSSGTPSATAPSNYGASPSATTPASPPSAVAFTLPGETPTPDASVANATAPLPSSDPAYSTASSVPATPSLPTSTTPPSSGVAPVSGYMPGSTNGATGYPTGSYPASNPSGSFYR